MNVFYKMIFCVIIIITTFTTAKSQIDFSMPDFQQLYKQAEQQAAMRYEASGPGVVLWNGKGESAIVRNVFGLSFGNYLFIKIVEKGKTRVYRPKHSGKGVEVPNYVKGDGCVLQVAKDYVDLTTPNGFYRFTQIKTFQGTVVPVPNVNEGNGNMPRSQSQSKSNIICRSCKGTGKCGSCNGKGYFYGFEMNRIECKQCSASNGRICTVCNGTGHW